MHQRTCLECGASLEGRHESALRCSATCRERAKGRAKYRRNHPGMTPYARKGTPCSVIDCSEKPVARGLCQRHYRIERRAEGVAWAKLGGGHSNARARARRHGATYEPIDPREIYERDNWTCGICLLPVDPALLHPDPMSVSLDHVLALANGGDHVPSNVQCSHLDCNVKKRDRLTF